MCILRGKRKANAIIVRILGEGMIFLLSPFTIALCALFLHVLSASTLSLILILHAAMVGYIRFYPSPPPPPHQLPCFISCEPFHHAPKSLSIHLVSAENHTWYSIIISVGTFILSRNKRSRIRKDGFWRSFPVLVTRFKQGKRTRARQR